MSTLIKLTQVLKERAKILHASQPKNQNRKNIVTNSKKTLKMVHIKKKKKKEKKEYLGIRGREKARMIPRA